MWVLKFCGNTFHYFKQTGGLDIKTQELWQSALFRRPFLYLKRLRGFTQLFDDCWQSFRVDALFTQSHTYWQWLHVQTSVQQSRDLQKDCGRESRTGDFRQLLSTDSKTVRHNSVHAVVSSATCVQIKGLAANVWQNVKHLKLYIYHPSSPGQHWDLCLLHSPWFGTILNANAC